MSDLRTLFEQVDVLDAEVTKLETVLEAKVAERSKVIKALAEEHGKKTYKFNGRDLTPVCRVSKMTGVESWYLRGKNERSVVEV